MGEVSSEEHELHAMYIINVPELLQQAAVQAVQECLSTLVEKEADTEALTLLDYPRLVVKPGEFYVRLHATVSYIRGMDV